MPKGRDEMGMKTLKKRSKKMNKGLQFRSLQFGTKPPSKSTVVGASDDVLSKFTPEQRQKLERFAKNTRMILANAVESLKTELRQLPSVKGISNDDERKVLINSMFLARFGKTPFEFERILFGNAVSKFAESL